MILDRPTRNPALYICQPIGRCTDISGSASGNSTNEGILADSMTTVADGLATR